MTTRRPRAADTYHHGNLRQELLDHAVELARAGGPDAVVLRDVQRMAGVSNSAAYRHYADRDALLAAVAEYAQSRLADAMVARIDAVPAGGRKARRAIGRLRATGQGYIDFALAEPGLFRTAFAPREVATADHSRQGEALGHGGVRSSSVPDPGPVHRRSGRRGGAVCPIGGTAWTKPRGPPCTGCPCCSSTVRSVRADVARKQLIVDRLLDVIGDGLR